MTSYEPVNMIILKLLQNFELSKPLYELQTKYAFVRLSRILGLWNSLTNRNAIVNKHLWFNLNASTSIIKDS